MEDGVRSNPQVKRMQERSLNRLDRSCIFVSWKAGTRTSAVGRRFQLFAFFFGDIFHVVHVGAGLRQHVVQVVADADEGESLFEELSDSRRSEEKDAENDFILASVLDQFLVAAPSSGEVYMCGNSYLL